MLFNYRSVLISHWHGDSDSEFIPQHIHLEGGWYFITTHDKNDADFLKRMADASQIQWSLSENQLGASFIKRENQFDVLHIP